MTVDEINKAREWLADFATGQSIGRECWGIIDTLEEALDAMEKALTERARPKEDS